ncbi:MAG: amino acid adenylation domain-containing protein [Candidatus Omnitrophota bacterium]
MERFYKTGDLARWLENGNIEFLGRIDHQVKIRGFRIELGEIETRLLAYEEIKDTVVICRKDKNRDNSLCAYFVSAHDLEISELREYLAKHLPDYMIPSYFVRLKQIPLNASGKINRKALPEPEIETDEGYVAPGNSVETKLAEIWSEVLGIDKAKISVHANFFQLGGHSLKAMMLISRIERQLNVKISLEKIFKYATIKKMSECIKESSNSQSVLIREIKPKRYYALSSAQKRMYMLYRMDEKGVGYNIPFICVLEGEIDKEKLESTFEKLIRRHESLRTSFHMIDDEPVQQVHDEVEFELNVLATEDTENTEENKEPKTKPKSKVFAPNFFKNGGPPEAIVKHFICPFDLSQAPLIRVGLIKETDRRHILILDMHHIISDGTSMNIIVNDFMAIVKGETLPELRIQYKDFSEWQNREGRESQNAQEVFWFNELDGELPVLELPVDYARPTVRSFEGNRINFELNREETNKLNALALENGATLYMVLLGAYNILLSKLSGQEDMIIGTPVAGRRHADLEHIIGMFVNTLALRHHPAGEKTFIEFLEEVKRHTLNAFENQDYPYEALIEHLGVNRDAGRNPLFDTMFVLQNMEMTKIEIPGLTLLPYSHENKTSKFDLTLIGAEIEDKLCFTFEYSTRLFKPKTIERFIVYFKSLIGQAIEKKERRISEFEIITEEERNRLLYEFNDTTTEYPKNKTIHELFEAQVMRAGDRIALFGVASHVGADPRVCPQFQLSYRELNQQTELLAKKLIEKGVGPGIIVGIQAHRSIEMIIGILGILKAGGAYLPLNPNQPKERTDFMLKDSGSELLVTTCSVGADLRVCPLVSEKSGAHMGAPLQIDTKSNLAYIIYTSGSTGTPKGVPITHSNFSPLIHWGYNLGISHKDRVIQNLSYYFDWSVWEMFIALTTGASLYMITEELVLNPEAEVHFILKHAITVLHATPTQYGYLLHVGKKLESLKYLFIGAEKLTVDLTRRSIASVSQDCRIFNMYGPTEATIISSVLEIDRKNIDDCYERSGMPIGVPVANSALLILNRHMDLLPIGVTGELYISGDGLASGYLNNPELTFEKFCLRRPGALFEKTAPGPRKNFWFGVLGFERFYKTGDLVRWLEDGNIEFLGRIDHQVKIRGFRIELGEIENRLLQHENVKEAVIVCKKDQHQDNCLCAYIVGEDNEHDVEDSILREYLSEHLPDYMVPAYIMTIDHMPLTPSGKIDLRALPEPDIQAGDGYVAPANAIEENLVAIWSEVLGIEKEKISIHANFFHLGGHSLKATVLLSKIHKALHVHIPLAQIFKTPTVFEIARIISQSQQTAFRDIPPVEEKEYYELSFNQKRLWFIYQMTPDSAAFHLPGRILLDHEVKDEWVEHTLEQLFLRHDSFRTGFKALDGQPVQYVVQKPIINLQKIDVSNLKEPEKQQERDRLFLQIATTPFDLTAIPLFRAALVKVESNVYEFMTNMHHIITDGWSIELIKKEFNTIYDGYRTGSVVALAPLPLQYKDFAEWHNRVLTDPQLPAYHFWKEKLQNDIPSFRLPADASQNREDSTGAAYQSIIDSDLKDRINQLAQDHNTTLFTVLFSTYMIFLSRFSGQGEVSCSIIGAGREHASLHDIVGFFVNSIIYHSVVDLNESFTDFLNRVSRDVVERFQYQDYPLELLFEELRQRYPEISVSFNMLHIRDSAQTPIPESLTSGPIPTVSESKFDLEPYVTEYSNGITVYWSYKKNLFHPETIAYMVEEYIKLLDFFTRKPESAFTTYRALNTLATPALPRVVQELEPGADTLPRFLAHQVHQTPDRVAVKIGVNHFTYAELNRTANAIAGWIRQSTPNQPHQRINLYFEHGYDMVAAILGTLKSGHVYVPLSTSYPVKRLSYMLANSESGLILTNNRNMEIAQELAEEHRIPIGNVDTLPLNLGTQELPDVSIHAKSPAYILYTSGSTGNPKGVLQNHENVLYYTRNWTRIFSITDKDKMTLFSSFCHDGSVQDMFGALLNGATLYLYDVKNREESVPDLSVFLIREKITIWHSVPSLFGYFINSLSGEEDFSGLRFILLGGEPLRAHEVQMAATYFPSCTLANIYGQTESSVSSTWLIDLAQPIRFFGTVRIGEPLDNTGIILMDEAKNVTGPLETGEIVVANPHMALGYWKNEEVTQKVFETHPSYGQIYRTGDLGRLLLDGSIEFIGRKDTQVKIRGFRIELGEIESRLLEHGRIAEAVVKVWEDDGDKYLCAYVVDKDATQIASALSFELKTYLSELLPDYMVPTYVMVLDRMPLTPGGKIDRRALPLPERMDRGSYVAPRNWMETKLQEIWAETLKSPGSIGIDDNFFDLGGHSLKATVLLSKIQKILDASVSLPEFFKNPTIRGLAEWINNMNINKNSRTGDGYAPIQPVEEKEYYAASSPQRRFFILQQLDPENTGFNISKVVIGEGKPDMERLTRVFATLIQRHEVFRTSFERLGESLIQNVHKNVRFEIETLPTPTGDEHAIDRLIGNFIRPFDLSRAPLLRVGVSPIDEERYLMAVDVHHIISDGLSQIILLKEFQDLYEGRELPPLNIQYKDFAEWQNSTRDDSEFKRQETYWLNMLNNDLPLLNLPTDYPRDNAQHFEGDAITFRIEKEELEALKRIAASHSATMYIILLAICNVWLSKICAQDKIVIGSGIGGRKHPDLQTMLGSLQNMIVLVNPVERDERFSTFLETVKRTVFDAFENQDYPFDELVIKSTAPREPGRNPLFDFFFILNNADLPSTPDQASSTLNPNPLNLKLYPYAQGSQKGKVRFDLALYGMDYGDTLGFSLEYGTKLFKSETATQLVKYFNDIIAAIRTNEDIGLNDIALSSGTGTATDDPFTSQDYLEFSF